MSERREEGIILKSTPFKEADRIVIVFTPNQGVLSLIVKHLSKNRPAMINLTTPLCRGEFIFKTGRSHLHRFIDGTIFDLHLPLRQSYERLECGAKMLNAILTSQMPEKSAPSLYALLITYLKHLENSPSPITLWASFQLKLLKHEGLLAIDTTCLACRQTPALRIVEGESRCVKCCDALSFPFTQKEWETLILLFHARQFKALFDLEISPTLIQGIEALYKSRLGT